MAHAPGREREWAATEMGWVRGWSGRAGGCNCKGPVVAGGFAAGVDVMCWRGRGRFAALGLRHLVVVGPRMEPVGVVTRHDLQEGVAEARARSAA